MRRCRGEGDIGIESQSVLLRDQTTNDDTTPGGPVYIHAHTCLHTPVIYSTIIGRWEPREVDEGV